MSTLIEFTGPARLDKRTKRLVHRLTEDDERRDELQRMLGGEEFLAIMAEDQQR